MLERRDPLERGALRRHLSSGAGRFPHRRLHDGRSCGESDAWVDQVMLLRTPPSLHDGGRRERASFDPDHAEAVAAIVRLLDADLHRRCISRHAQVAPGVDEHPGEPELRRRPPPQRPPSTPWRGRRGRSRRPRAVGRDGHGSRSPTSDRTEPAQASSSRRRDRSRTSRGRTRPRSTRRGPLDRTTHPSPRRRPAPSRRPRRTASRPPSTRRPSGSRWIARCPRGTVRSALPLARRSQRSPGRPRRTGPIRPRP